MSIDQVVGRFAPSGDLAWSRLRSGRVQKLYPFSRRRHRTSKGLGCGLHFARNLSPPVGEVIGHSKADRRILNPAYLADQFRKLGHEASGLSGKDRLQRFALPLIGALVEKPDERQLSFASPYIAVKRPDADDV